MAYNTPELLLVGAAQNLVLGELTPKNSVFQNVDDDNISYDPGPNTDSSSW